MKASELRIGNLAQDYNERLIYINPDIIFNWVKINSNQNTAIIPIPLTEEWIIKFGFYKHAGVWRVKLRNDFFLRCNLYKDILGMALDEHDAVGGRETVSLNSIKYVHQLQNIYFALTNEELILNK